MSDYFCSPHSLDARNSKRASVHAATRQARTISKGPIGGHADAKPQGHMDITLARLSSVPSPRLLYVAVIGSYMHDALFASTPVGRIRAIFPLLRTDMQALIHSEKWLPHSNI